MPEVSEQSLDRARALLAGWDPAGHEVENARYVYEADHASLLADFFEIWPQIDEAGLAEAYKTGMALPDRQSSTDGQSGDVLAAQQFANLLMHVLRRDWPSGNLMELQERLREMVVRANEGKATPGVKKDQILTQLRPVLRAVNKATIYDHSSMVDGHSYMGPGEAPYCLGNLGVPYRFIRVSNAEIMAEDFKKATGLDVGEQDIPRMKALGERFYTATSKFGIFCLPRVFIPVIHDLGNIVPLDASDFLNLVEDVVSYFEALPAVIATNLARVRSIIEAAEEREREALSVRLKTERVRQDALKIAAQAAEEARREGEYLARIGVLEREIAEILKDFDPVAEYKKLLERREKVAVIDHKLILVQDKIRPLYDKIVQEQPSDYSQLSYAEMAMRLLGEKRKEIERILRIQSFGGEKLPERNWMELPADICEIPSLPGTDLRSATRVANLEAMKVSLIRKRDALVEANNQADSTVREAQERLDAEINNFCGLESEVSSVKLGLINLGRIGRFFLLFASEEDPTQVLPTTKIRHFFDRYTAHLRR